MIAYNKMLLIRETFNPIGLFGLFQTDGKKHNYIRDEEFSVFPFFKLAILLCMSSEYHQTKI